MASDEPTLGVVPGTDALTEHTDAPEAPVRSKAFEEMDDTMARPKAPPTHAGALTADVEKEPLQ